MIVCLTSHIFCLIPHPQISAMIGEMMATKIGCVWNQALQLHSPFSQFVILFWTVHLVQKEKWSQKMLPLTFLRQPNLVFMWTLLWRILVGSSTAAYLMSSCCWWAENASCNKKLNFTSLSTTRRSERVAPWKRIYLNTNAFNFEETSVNEQASYSILSIKANFGQCVCVIVWRYRGQRWRCYHRAGN